MKKKIILLLFVLAISILLNPFSCPIAYAEENNELQIETIYPENILEYADLTNISSFSINEKYIIYTLDGNNINILNKNTNKIEVINGFSGITKMKLADDMILVADNIACKVIKNISVEPTISTLIEVNYTEVKAIDFYIDNTSIKIGIINNDTFSLYEYNLDLSKSEINAGRTATCSDAQFTNAYMLAINKTNAYIIYAKSNIEPILTGICTLNYSEKIPMIKDFYPNAKVIDTIYLDNTEYIVTFTGEILYLLKSDATEVHKVTITNENNINTSSFPILKVTDIDYFENRIYVSDSSYKTIQSFDILKSDTSTTLESKEIILCSTSFDKGRFNNVHDIFIQNDEIFTADSGNNRIQYLDKNTPMLISDSFMNTPHSVNLDKYNNLYFVSNSASGSILYQYTYNDKSFIKSNQYNTVNSNPIGFVSDICISNSNNVYLLDYTNNNLLYLTNNGLEIKTRLTITLNSTSQIYYLKCFDNLVIFNNENVYYLSPEGTIIDYISIPTSRFISVDFDKIYVATEGEILLISANASDINLTSEKLSINNFNRYSTMSFDIVSRQMYAFDSSRSCIVKFSCDLADTPFENHDIGSLDYLQNSDTLIPLLIIENKPIYSYPYELGIHYNKDKVITNAVAIGEYINNNTQYYRVIINYENTLAIGYVLKEDTSQINIIYSPINVITTNQIVPVYKYPTLLKYNGNRLVVDTIKINTRITLTSLFPVSLDEKTFYIYNVGNHKGFVFNADIVLDESKTIRNLNTENATIKLIGKETTAMLEDDNETKIVSLKDSTRIYVENYDKNKKYTKVIFKDSNLNTYEGYVLTSDIEMDKLDNYKIILIVVIIISLIILALIITTYIIIRKRNKK